MINVYGFVMVVAAFFNAISQIILKKCANETVGKSFIEKIINRKVFGAYCIFAAVMIVNVYAYRGVDFKYGGIIQSIGQLFVVFLSIILCGERLSKARIVGNILIIIGIILYSFY